MRSVDQAEKRGLTETRKGIGFAELCLALELAALKAVRSRHSKHNHKVREHPQGEIAFHGEDGKMKPSWRMRQCKGGGKWKTHRDSEALSQAC